MRDYRAEVIARQRGIDEKNNQAAKAIQEQLALEQGRKHEAEAVHKQGLIGHFERFFALNGAIEPKEPLSVLNEISRWCGQIWNLIASELEKERQIVEQVLTDNPQLRECETIEAFNSETGEIIGTYEVPKEWRTR